MIDSYTEVKCEYGGPDPGKPSPGIMQVFYENEVPAMVDFLCPCGCGRTCPTHLTNANPNLPQGHRWTYCIGPTITPSIRCLSGCKSHFNITDGKAIMHADSGK